VGGGFGPGGDEYRSELQATFREVPGVHWIGQAPDVRPYLAAADVNIAPSLSENIGSPSEAAFLGLPSIASNVGGLPEVVVDGWTGWLVEPNDVRSLSFAIEHAAGAGPAVLALRAAKALQRARELHDEAANDIAWADVVEQVAARSRR
jgi:glycosyltransferase involved in cell wall biosynthesis